MEAPPAPVRHNPGVVIYPDKGKYHKREVFADGSKGTERMIPVDAPRPGRAFEQADEQRQDYYLITPDRELQVRDPDGVVWRGRA